MDQSGAMLFGRNTYEMMEGAWPAVARDGKAPRAMREWAQKLEAKAKYVVSGSRSDFPWQNTTKVEGDLREAISALKAKTERGVLVGAPKLAVALEELGLIDEYHRRSSHHPWPRADVVSWPVECAASRAPLDAAVQVRRAGAPLPSQNGMSVEGSERFTGGCLCGRVRIVARDGRTASACDTASLADVGALGNHCPRSNCRGHDHRQARVVSESGGLDLSTRDSRATQMPEEPVKCAAMTDVGIMGEVEFSSAAKRDEWQSVACIPAGDANTVKAVLTALAKADLPLWRTGEHGNRWFLMAVLPEDRWATFSPALTAAILAIEGRGKGSLQAFDFLRPPTEDGAFEGVVIEVDAEGARERAPNPRDQKRGMRLSLDLELELPHAYGDSVRERRKAFKVHAFLAVISPKLRRHVVAPSLLEYMKRSGDEWALLAKEHGFTLPPQFLALADNMEDVYILVDTERWGSWEILSPTRAKELMAFIEDSAKNLPEEFEQFVGMLPLFGLDFDSLLLAKDGSIHLCRRAGVDLSESPFVRDFDALLDELVSWSVDEDDK